MNKYSQIKLPNILQKFVYTKSSKNQMLRVVVKDGQVFKIDRAFNINDMLDSKTPLQERCCTYEVDKLIKPQSQLSIDIMRLKRSQLAGISDVPKAIETQLTLATNQILTQLEILKLSMQSGYFYFKFDRDSQLVLTFCGGLNVSVLDTETQEESLMAVNPDGKHPIFRRIATESKKPLPPRPKSSGFKMIAPKPKLVDKRAAWASQAAN